MAKKGAFNTLLGMGTIVLGAAYVYGQNFSVGTTDYFVENPRFDNALNGFTIAHLSDIHLPNQMVDVNAIVKQVAEIQPDIIALSGDMIETDATGLEEAELYTFLRALTDIAPTFATFGNHDAVSLHQNMLIRAMAKAGVVHLNDRAITYTYKGQAITLMGLDDKANRHFLNGDALRTVSLTTEQKMQPKILLAHHPEAFLRYHENIDKSPDLVLSGHAHGGQIRLPFIGGLFAPGQGRLPKYTSGVFYLPGNPAKQMVVSRGIGASSFPIRLNNRPEIVAVHLTTDIDRAVSGLTEAIDYVAEQEGAVTSNTIRENHAAKQAERAQAHGYFSEKEDLDLAEVSASNQATAATTSASIDATADVIISELNHRKGVDGLQTTPVPPAPVAEYDDDVVDRTSIDLPKYEVAEEKVTHASDLTESYILLDPETKERTVVAERVDAEQIFSDNLNEEMFIVADPKKK
ncbi:hypothetical protein EF384_05225 [Aerococcus agrisoli]|uniref:Calcineurin-like phosphoesterase domain-containing protein n=1 Tax=Aerococcus agrisoli TaxID=2487350 RepID=A0A3N4GGM5_9LACT|nr:metallophosphoesterase [Aerococcus agrisoli]RPA60567.1 hypothetical protein EF384_05225 [Aerococcus agrisoli]